MRSSLSTTSKLFGGKLIAIRDTASPSSSACPLFVQAPTCWAKKIESMLTYAYRMKALLFTLVRAFEFELAVPAADIGRKISIVQRPMVRSEPGAGAQMPLLVKSYVRPT